MDEQIPCRLPPLAVGFKALGGSWWACRSGRKEFSLLVCCVVGMYICCASSFTIFAQSWIAHGRIG
eukprot:scaffold514936_cov33-Prasinocladus_malaysianus.AAC.1